MTSCFRPWESTSTKSFQIFLFVSQNRKQTTSSVQPIRSSIELDLLFLWLPETSRLTVQVEVAFNSEGRNTICTALSSWQCSCPFPSKQPSQQALCKPYNNFPGAPELPAHTPNTPRPMMDSRVSQRQIWSGSTRVGCGVAAPQSPNKGAEQVPWWFPGWPRLPGKSPAMRQVWPAGEGTR